MKSNKIHRTICSWLNSLWVLQIPNQFWERNQTNVWKSRLNFDLVWFLTFNQTMLVRCRSAHVSAKACEVLFTKYAVSFFAHENAVSSALIGIVPALCTFNFMYNDLLLFLFDRLLRVNNHSSKLLYSFCGCFFFVFAIEQIVPYTRTAYNMNRNIKRNKNHIEWSTIKTKMNFKICSKPFTFINLGIVFKNAHQHDHHGTIVCYNETRKTTQWMKFNDFVIRDLIEYKH